MSKSLTIMSLNVGRLLQERTRTYLQSLGTTEPLPDILCLQDFPFRDLSLLERLPHVAFGPMTNHLINGERAVVGIAIASRYFMPDIRHHITWGDGVLKNLRGINEKNQRHLGAESDTLVGATENRLVICATVIKGGVEFNIATTHGMWVRGGVINDAQRCCVGKLRDVLIKEAYMRDGLVLMGDMNFGRGGETYQLFTEEFRDCIPQEIDNTLDPEHPAACKGLKIVTDYVMTGHGGYPENGYSVTDVRLRPGVSDHCALSATVSRK